MKKPDFKNIPVFSAHKFTWKGPVGIAEMSDFGVWADPGGLVWEDSTDIGFYVQGRSDKKLFILEETVYEDCELVLQCYSTLDHKFVINIFND